MLLFCFLLFSLLISNIREWPLFPHRFQKASFDECQMHVMIRFFSPRAAVLVPRSSTRGSLLSLEYLLSDSQIEFPNLPQLCSRVHNQDSSFRFGLGRILVKIQLKV